MCLSNDFRKTKIGMCGRASARPGFSVAFGPTTAENNRGRRGVWLRKRGKEVYIHKFYLSKTTLLAENINFCLSEIGENTGRRPVFRTASPGYLKK